MISEKGKGVGARGRGLGAGSGRCGAFVDAEDVILRALRSFAPETGPVFDKQRALAAGARIRELSKGLTLGGLTIRELIDEGRP
jgi:hypothetical protein